MSSTAVLAAAALADPLHMHTQNPMIIAKKTSAIIIKTRVLFSSVLLSVLLTATLTAAVGAAATEGADVVRYSHMPHRNRHWLGVLVHIKLD